MNLSSVIAIITIYFVAAMVGLSWAVRSIHGYLRKAVKRIRRQRNEDLRWHRDSLLAYMRAEAAQKH